MQSKQHMAYLGIVNRHEQKAKFVAFGTLIKHFETKIRQFFTSFDMTVLCTCYSKTPRYQDLAIFVWITMTTDGQTDHFTPCARVG